MQVAVWDFNGVIVDDVNAHRVAFNSILAMFDLPPIDTIDKCQRMTSVPYIDGILATGITREQFFANVMKIDASYHDAYMACPEAYRLRKGVEAALDHVSATGGDNIILTNTRRDVIETQLERIGIRDKFAWVSTSDDRKETGVKLNKVERLGAYFKKAGRRPGFIVGDSIEEPAVGKAFGLKSIAVTGGWFDRDRLEKCDADMVVDCISQIPSVLNTRPFRPA